MAKMSLHRCIAEIKAIEEFMQTLPSIAFVTLLRGEQTEESKAVKHAAQGNFDKVLAKLRNLANLKAARNKANSSVKITVAGAEYTIDEALARKANIVVEQRLLQQLKAQYSRNQQLSDAANVQVENEIQRTITSILSGRAATPEEIKAIRDSAEKSQKQSVLTFDGFDTKIKSLENDINKFVLEIDYTLSEANATNSVEVDLLD